MDVIAWSIGLVAGFRIRSLKAAMGLAAISSVSVTAYQHFLADPQVWRGEFPADWIGATAMIAVSCLFAYIGSIFRVRRERRAQTV